jgi:gamma-butyrobetaine dioxygenase
LFLKLGEFLDKHRYTGQTFYKVVQDSATSTWDRKILQSSGGIPTFQFNDVMNNESVLHDWLSELDLTGLTLLKNAPLERGPVTQLCNLVGYPRNSMYGLSWDVESIPNPNNVAYTSLPLPLHADLCYYESPPGVQLLHCIKFDQKTGGENIFVDAFKVANDLQKVSQEAFQTLSAVKTTFHKEDERHHLKFAHPIIQLEYGSGAIEAINWSPPFEGVQFIVEQFVERYYDARRLWSKMLNDPTYSIQHRLSPGDIVVFNNRRVLHARTAFDEKEGHRLLEGAYLGSDEWIEKLRVLKRKHSPGSPIHFGSGSVM